MVDKIKSINNYYLILEYCNGGNLAQYIDLVGKVNENVASMITK